MDGVDVRTVRRGQRHRERVAIDGLDRPLNLDSGLALSGSGETQNRQKDAEHEGDCLSHPAPPSAAGPRVEVLHRYVAA